MDFKPEQLLSDAIEAARHAMRDLDPDQVPASMRRVAGYAGGTLPPPFARSLIAELDTNEFLRSKALEAWQGESPGAGERKFASFSFLERDDGWLIDVLSASFGLGGQVSASVDRTLQIERDAYEAEATSLRGRLKASRKDHKRIVGGLREAARSRPDSEREDRVAERRLAEELEGNSRAHLRRVEELESRLAATQEELQFARETARADRRLRAEAESAHRAAIADDPPSMQPDALAERLDAIAAMAAATGSGPDVVAEPAPVPVSDPIHFPGTIVPDSAEAIEWLLGAEATVFVDGYNLGFLLAGRLDPVQARTLAEEAVGRMAVVARHVEIVVVFDSEIEADDAVARRSAGVDIVFSSGGRSADDEIVARCRSASDPVVITNDREVRHRAEAVGAITLWSDALAEWSRRH